MPFKSEKQRKWMWANDPEMAEKWEEEEKNEGKIMKISKRQLRRIIKEEKRKLSEDEDWHTPIQKQTSSSHRTSQGESIADILNQIDELMETAYAIARDMESNEDDEGIQNIRARVDSWSDSYGTGEW